MLLYIKVLNTPGARYVCEGEVERACFRVKKLGLKRDDLVIEASRDPLPAGGSPVVVVVATLYPEDAIPKKILEKLSRVIAAAIKRTHGARHRAVNVTVHCPSPSQVTLRGRK